MYNIRYNERGVIMETISYSQLRNNLSSTLDKVNEDHAPVIVTRQNGKSAVLVSLEDFQSFEETAYLMASPANAERLNEAIAQIESGNSVERELIE